MKKAAIYVRVSTEGQEQEGTSLQTQLEACVKYAEQKGHAVTYQFSEAHSGLKLERPKLDELRELVRTGSLDMVLVYSLDRFSRNATHGVILRDELDKHQVILESVTEDIEHTPLGEAITYLRGTFAQIEAEKIRERTMRGKVQFAKDGKIPSRMSCFGLKHGQGDKKGFLLHTPQISIAREILQRGLAGESTRQITRDLQVRGIKGARGGQLHRSLVIGVLRNAKTYAGLLSWKGHEIRDKVEPIITEQEADKILDRLAKNKIYAQGFGKRTWLSGRVFCGVCGKRFQLMTKRRSYCQGTDKCEPVRCTTKGISFNKIASMAYGNMILALSEPKTVIAKAKVAHDDWTRHKNVISQLNESREQQTHNWEKKRRALSFQHEMGGLSDEEYIKRLASLKKEQAGTPTLEAFDITEPPTPEQVEATFSMLVEYAPLRRRFKDVLENPQDEQALRLAEDIDLKVFVDPKGSKIKMNLRITAPALQTEDTPVFPLGAETQGYGEIAYAKQDFNKIHPYPLAVR